MKLTMPIIVGAFVLLAGVSILLQAIFKIHLPLMRSALAVLFILLGVQMLAGAWWRRPTAQAARGAVVMSESTFAPVEASPVMKYDVLFGRGAVDLTHLKRPERAASIEVNVIFSAATLTIDPTWPIVVEGSSAFGELRMPDETMAAFGTARYRTQGERDPILRIRVSTVFGSCRVYNSHAQVGGSAVSALTR